MSPAEHGFKTHQTICLNIDLWSVVQFQLAERDSLAQSQFKFALFSSFGFHLRKEVEKTATTGGLGLIESEIRVLQQQPAL